MFFFELLSLNTLREKCPNTDFFLVRIFLYSVRILENTDQRKLCIWTLFTQWYRLVRSVAFTRIPALPAQCDIFPIRLAKPNVDLKTHVSFNCGCLSSKKADADGRGRRKERLLVIN